MSMYFVFSIRHWIRLVVICFLLFRTSLRCQYELRDQWTNLCTDMFWVSVWNDQWPHFVYRELLLFGGLLLWWDDWHLCSRLWMSIYYAWWNSSSSISELSFLSSREISESLSCGNTLNIRLCPISVWPIRRDWDL